MFTSTNRAKRLLPCRPWRIVVLVPVLLFSTIVLTLLFLMGEAGPAKNANYMGIEMGSSNPGADWIRYTTVTGYFMQDDPRTDDMGFDYSATHFGLIDQPYDTDSSLPSPVDTLTPWQRFGHKFVELNKSAPEGTVFKLLFLGRHGEGYHNVAEAFYGTQAWDCKWAALDGNGTMTWSDAHLTPLGESQAQSAHSAFTNLITTQKSPLLPTVYYVSPLSRAIQTARITFEALPLQPPPPFTPIVKELLREANGIHTCDRRSSKSYIYSTFPSCTFEAGFAEHDPLWLPNLRESDSALDYRLKQLLDDVFTQEWEGGANDNDGDGEASNKSGSSVISLTYHSGAIAGTLRVLGHRKFSLLTGGVIPVLVKAERVKGPAPEVEVQPWVPGPDCD